MIFLLTIQGSYKSYAGFSSRSVRTIWEQHDKQETEVAPDVYTKLAEDTTYKLWELANVSITYLNKPMKDG